MLLTARQELVLCKVVEAYLRAGQPVASRTLATDADLRCAASTIRNELALLEEHGLLAHPHTSAGRVPTDAGQRYVVDRMLANGTALVPAPRLELSLIRELDDAMRTTSETLSQVTNLLAIVSAPSAGAATVRHIEVIALQPSVVMVVVITSAGGVAKYVCTFESSVDPGLIAWAAEYLNDRLGGLPAGARMANQRLADPSLSPQERTFVERLSPAFSETAVAGEDTLYVDGTSRLLGAHRFAGVEAINELVELLGQRVALLGVLRHALDARDTYVRIGRENEVPALRTLSLVASPYGLASRTLGTVSVIGPVRMDYGAAIGAVRAAARELSHFVESVYEGV